MYMSFRVIGETYTSITAKLCPYMWYVPAFREGLVPLALVLNFLYGGSIEDVYVFQSNWGGIYIHIIFMRSRFISFYLHEFDVLDICELMLWDIVNCCFGYRELLFWIL
ncbi:hypothetical protein Syun_011887 [Stephania yunnanensis]|uniref:Uncharacterized protein n=1 Tax=Stephania yunnanensis TaxID=152371 RepID=A0AAP0K0V0_9MAGN